MNTYSIRLLALDTQGKPLAQHRIELWDNDPKKDDFICEATTDTEGHCSFRFDETHFGDFGGKPDVYFKVFNKEAFLSSTRGATVFNLKFTNARITLRVGAEVTVENTRKADQIPFQVKDLQKEPGVFTGNAAVFVTNKLNLALSGEVQRLLNDADPQILGAAKDIQLDYKIWLDKTLGELIQEAVLPVLLQDCEIKKLLEERKLTEALIKNKRSVCEVLHVDLPVRKNPLFQEEVRILMTTELVAAFDLNAELAERLLEKSFNWERATGEQWNMLVEEQVITEKEKETLQRGFVLSRFTGGNATLSAGLHKKLPKLQDMVKWDADDWKEMIAAAEGGTPGEETTEEYANNLLRLAQRNFPSAFFIERKVRRALPAADLLAELNQLQDSKTTAKKGGKGEQDGVKKLSFEHAPTLRQVANTYRHLGAHELLSDAAASPQAKLKELDARQSYLHKFLENNPNVELRSTDFFKKDEKGKRTFKFTGIPKEQQDGVRRQMMAFQRVARLAGSFEAQEALLAAGYDNAADLVQARRGVVAAQLGASLPKSAIDAILTTAQQHYNQAVHTTLAIRDIDKTRFVGFSVENYPESLINQLQDIDGYSDMFGSQDYCECDHCKSIFGPAAYFVDLMRFVEDNVGIYTLENGLPKHPLNANADPDPNKHPEPIPNADNHPIALKTRRPDLWNLELSCENTNGVLPYLQIVNEIKEHYIQSVMAGIRNRPLAETDVWQEMSLLPLQGSGGSGSGGGSSSGGGSGSSSSASSGSAFRLGGNANAATWKNGFRLTFNRPFEESLMLLEQFGLRYADVLRALQVNTSGRAEEAYLGASFEEWISMSTQDTLLDDLRDLRFGFPADRPETTEDGEVIDPGFSLAQCPVNTFLRATGLSREDAGFLLSSRSSLYRLHNTVKLKRTPVALDIQQFIETVEGLDNAQVLDFIHRLLRLKRLLPWSLRELDMAVQTVWDSTQQTETTLTEGVIRETARIREIQHRLELTVEEALGICRVIPNVSVRTRTLHNEFLNLSVDEPVPGLLDRLFDPSKIHIRDNSTDSMSADLLAESGQLPYLLKGLGTNEADYRRIFQYLFGTATNTFLTLQNVSACYQIVRSAKAFGLSVEEMLYWLELTPGGSLFDAARILRLAAQQEQLLALPLSLSEMKFIVSVQPQAITRMESAFSGQAGMEAVDAWLTEWLADSRLSISMDDLKQYLPSEKSALYIRPFVEALKVKGILVPVDDTTCRVTALNLLDHTDIPDEVILELEEVEIDTTTNQPVINTATNAPNIVKVAYPLPIHGKVRIKMTKDLNERFITAGVRSDSIADHLGLLFKTAVGMIRAMAVWCENYNSATQAALSCLPVTDAEYPDAVRTALIGLFKHFERSYLLFSKLGLDEEDVQWLHANASLMIQGTGNDLLNQINNLGEFIHLADYKRFKDQAGNAAGVDAYRTALKGARATWFEAHLEPISTVLQCEPGQLVALKTFSPGSTPGTQPTDILVSLERTVGLAKKLGIWNAGILNALKENTYENALKYEPALRSAFRARYAREEDYEKAWEPVEERINELRRDVLCSFLLALDQQNRFQDTGDLYAYFLVDVEMSGCAKVSRILAATLTLQTYVHRVLMGLEISTKGADGTQVQAFLGDPDIEHPDQDTQKIYRDQWEWRKNYRVWEANRKVFLYPENWIEPELRDNKSPLFKTLEDELLQQKISLESAEGAYKEYLKGFAEVGNLLIAGAVFNESIQFPIHYIFGRTATDPFIYYFRKMEMIGSQSNNVTNQWGPWQKIDITISSPEVTPFIFRKQLYIFWVEILSEGRNSISNGNSTFNGTKHKITLLFSKLQENGKWLQPQRFDFHEFQGKSGNTPTYADEVNNIMVDGFVDNYSLSSYSDLYSLRDYYLESRYLKRLYVSDIEKENYIKIVYNREIMGSNSYRYSRSLMRNLNLFNNKLELSDSKNRFQSYLKVLPKESGGNYTHAKRVSRYWSPLKEDFEIDYYIYNPNTGEDVGTNSGDIVDIDSSYYIDCQQVNSSFRHGGFQLSNDLIIKVQREGLLLHKRWEGLDSYRFGLVKLNTTVIPELQELLITKGIDSFISIETQNGIHDKPIPAKEVNNVNVEIVPQNSLHFSGSHGLYFRELFFHIPFLIADHLNAEGKYKEADYWYRKIFDPAAPMDQYVVGSKDRYWQYLEFRNQTIPKLLEILNDAAAISQYENDPFNPHAIARMRRSAYMKSIVMKYVDNLLDWGDSLFRRDTWESNSEAMMLYMLAHDILGQRPQQLGKCESEIKTENCGCAEPVTYSRLMESDVSPFVYYVENLVMTPSPSGGTPIGGSSGGGVTGGEEEWTANIFSYEDMTNTAVQSSADSARTGQDATAVGGDQTALRTAEGGFLSQLGSHMFQRGEESLVFCIPNNEKMLDYWDRVGDRLYKIRNCMNIEGVTRSLDLFQPPINPALLVNAFAAGLSVDDVLNSLYGDLPAYRFSYLVEKAKSFAGTVQSFGGAVLSALEKKDSEALILLRSTQEQNILKMTKEVKKKAIEESNYQLLNLEITKLTTTFRRDYYSKLIEDDLNAWEIVQQASTHAANLLAYPRGTLESLSGIVAQIPQVGAPTAMTFGGQQIKEMAKSAAGSVGAIQSFLHGVASSAGIVAGNKRRKEEWRFQRDTLTRELFGLEPQIAASKIRLAIAEKDLEIHEKQIEQAEETHGFYKNKLTGLGLYNYLAKRLNSLHRMAFNTAMDMAKQAEAAYKFETGNESTGISGGTFWDASRVGLLSGESLTLELQQLETDFINWNRRQMEIRQSFSMRMIDPEALLALQKGGKCTFVIPEWAFDMQYPGHYRRRIVSVQITIPCVAGPYHNIAATLAMTKGSIRKGMGSTDKTEGFPFRGSSMIATSSANNDGGQFDLNFRDERFLPFEGAGAVNSEWVLELPNTFRLFDYETISDVVFHISYRSKYDGVLKGNVERDLKGAINAHKGQGQMRLFNLKSEFPDVYFRLPQASTTDPVILELTRQHFPYFAKDFDIIVKTIDSIDQDGIPTSIAMVDATLDDTLKIKITAASAVSVKIGFAIDALSTDPVFKS